MNKDQVRLWTRDFNLLTSSNLLLSISFYFLLPTLPIFVVNALGADKSQIGYIVGVYTIAAVSIRPLAGYILDSIGRRPVFLYALFLFAFMMPVYTFAGSLAVLLLIRLVHGLSWGIITTSSSTIVADIIPDQRRGEGVGYYGLSMTIAMAIGPPLGLWLTGETSFAQLFNTAGVLAVAALLLASFVKYPKIPATKRSLNWESFFEVKVLPVAAVMFFVTVVYGGLITFITLYGPEVGMKNSGLFFLFYAVFTGISRPLAGNVFDKKGPNWVIAIGFFSLITSFLLLALWQTPIGFLTSAAVMGIGFGLVWPCLMAMNINMVPPHRRGVANSTYFSSLDLGIGTGSVILGIIANNSSLSTMYLVCAFIVIVPAILFFSYTGKKYLNAVSGLKPETIAVTE